MDARNTADYDSTDWCLPIQGRNYSIDSSTRRSDAESIIFSSSNSMLTAPTSTAPSEHRRHYSSLEQTSRLCLNSSVTVSIVRGTRLFKFRYTYIDICKDAAGDLRALELGDQSGVSGPFIHTFPSCRRPVPHLEYPTAASQKADLRVSFLEEQAVQTAGTIFPSQPYYKFEHELDCKQFQEALLGQMVVFTAGVAEVKSKGRGEECISQNLRILKASNATQSIVFFANSQRKERKRYVSVPLRCIEHIDPNKKAGRPITLRLRSDNEMLKQMKSLSILLLDDHDQRQFFGLLCHGVGYQPGM